MVCAKVKNDYSGPMQSRKLSSRKASVPVARIRVCNGVKLSPAGGTNEATSTKLSRYAATPASIQASKRFLNGVQETTR